MSWQSKTLKRKVKSFRSRKTFLGLKSKVRGPCVDLLSWHEKTEDDPCDASLLVVQRWSYLAGVSDRKKNAEEQEKCTQT